MNVLSLAVEILLIGVISAQQLIGGSWSSAGRSGWNSLSPMPGSSSWRQSRISGGGSRLGVERILGSSILGRPLRMGEFGLPRHGGAGIGRAHSDGTRDGWDGNPATMGRFRHSWVDPLGGRALPMGWNGDFGRINHLFVG